MMFRVNIKYRVRNFHVFADFFYYLATSFERYLKARGFHLIENYSTLMILVHILECELE